MTDDLLHAPLTIEYGFNRTTGPVVGAFYTGLREGKVLGIKGADGRVVCPPVEYDPVTGVPTTEVVEVGPNATITAFCVVHIGFGVNAPPTPFVSALFLADGAVVSLYGTVGEVEYDKVRIGMRVEPVWVDDDALTTSMENIKYWRPIDEPDVPAEQLKGHM